MGSPRSPSGGRLGADVLQKMLLQRDSDRNLVVPNSPIELPQRPNPHAATSNTSPTTSQPPRLESRRNTSVSFGGIEFLDDDAPSPLSAPRRTEATAWPLVHEQRRINSSVSPRGIQQANPFESVSSIETSSSAEESMGHRYDDKQGPVVTASPAVEQESAWPLPNLPAKSNLSSQIGGGVTRRNTSVSFGGTEYRERAESIASSAESTTASGIYSLYSRNKGYFRSRRIARNRIEKPWINERKKTWQWATIIPRIGIICGLLLAGGLVYLGYSSVIQHNYCMVMEDNFNTPTLNSSIWTHEVELGGFGNGEFEVTTNTDENVYIQDGKLVIKPTLQNETLLTANYTVLNLTTQGCTSNLWSNCWTATNATNYTIINPVKSGRINTKNSATIKYGRVEVVAKMPVGDWLWPAIWMMPVNSAYGSWPASGEIDIAESRGNNYTYPDGGNNIISSTLHWGPTPNQDAYWRTYEKRQVLHSTFADGFHTFGLEWSEKYLFTYVDSRLHQVLYTPFTQPLWQRGAFPQVDNGVILSDPWTATGRDNTPFDQSFYLILNVAVGGTNGFFKDAEANKPWSNSAKNASAYFWQAKDQWYPTWVDGQAQMEVESVKMWQQCD